MGVCLPCWKNNKEASVSEPGRVDRLVIKGSREGGRISERSGPL